MQPEGSIPEYSELVKYLYEKGFYVEKYNINLASYEILCDYNKIIVVPISTNEEETIYIFTGTAQKDRILSSPTEFRLTLFDKNGKEFRDDDLVMLSVVRIESENIRNLYTRSYAQWRFGQTFEKGIQLDPEKYLMFQAQKEIGRFDIDIRNIDLFKRKNKIEMGEDRMVWIDE